MVSREIYFLNVEEVLYIHGAETTYAGHDQTIRDIKLLESAVENTRLIYENSYVTDIFGLAASYIKSIAMNHPFVDGNKRTAAATAMVFLEYNGFILQENSDEALANKVLALINKKLSQEGMTSYLKKNSKKVF